MIGKVTISIYIGILFHIFLGIYLFINMSYIERNTTIWILNIEKRLKKQIYQF